MTAVFEKNKLPDESIRTTFKGAIIFGFRPAIPGMREDTVHLSR